MQPQSLAVGYARVSREDEDINNQVHAIEDYAKTNNLTLVGVFRDIDVSGAKPALEREGFRQMLAALESMPAIRTIIVFDITRLGRDMLDVMDTYKLLTERGYNILFIKHPELNVIQSTPLAEAIRKATLAMLSVTAEIERALISERTKSALARAKAMGKHIGRRGTQIPIDVVRQYLSMGLTKKAIYRLLVQQGLLRYQERGVVKVLSYNQFLVRLKALGL
ncbi:MAG: recombinase family protein [Vulcanisaeta sp.]|jgi:DNA invertase Pin-like site-specific DNA recombinase|nr:recombinase family protein [Vulcanisaeta sp.]